MSTNVEYAQILTAIGKLSDEVHELSAYLSRLDERMIALDSKVDTRVNVVELQVKTLESRVQSLVDKCQDLEIRLNRLNDSHKALIEDFDDEIEKKKAWHNRFLIPLVLMAAAAIASSMITLRIGL